MVQIADPVTMQRAERFAAVAMPRLGSLCDQMQLTLGEAQIGYALLLAEVLSHYSAADREAIVNQLPAGLLELAGEFERRRASGLLEKTSPPTPPTSGSAQ